MGVRSCLMLGRRTSAVFSISATRRICVRHGKGQLGERRADDPNRLTCTDRKRARWRAAMSW